MSHHNVFVNGKVHVRRRMCATCIFRPGNLMHLEEGRRDMMVATCGDDGVIPCHEHLENPIEPVCHGFYALRGSMTLRLADALDYIEWWDD